MLHIKPYELTQSMAVGEIECDGCRGRQFRVAVVDDTTVAENDGRSIEGMDFDFNDLFLQCIFCNKMYHIGEMSNVDN